MHFCASVAIETMSRGGFYKNSLYDIEKNAGSRLPGFTKMSLEERWLGMVISHVVDGNRKVILHLFGGVGLQKYSKHALTKSFYVFFSSAGSRLAADWQSAGSRLTNIWKLLQ